MVNYCLLHWRKIHKNSFIRDRELINASYPVEYIWL